MLKTKLNCIAVLVMFSFTSGTAFATELDVGGNTMVTVELLNCGYIDEYGNRYEKSRSAGHMALYDKDCGNKREFDYEDKQTIVLTLNGTKVHNRVGSSHYGCHSDNSGAKDASDEIWNPNSNYILLHRNNVKDVTYAVAIPSSQGLSCDKLRTNNRYQEIQ